MTAKFHQLGICIEAMWFHSYYAISVLIRLSQTLLCMHNYVISMVTVV